MSNSASENTRTVGIGRIAQWSVSHRWIVVVGWIALAVVGGFLTGKSSDRLSFSFDLPGQPAFETNSAIVQHYGSGGDNPPLVVVVQAPAGRKVSDLAVERQISTLFATTSASLPGSRSVSMISTPDSDLTSEDGRITFQLIYPVPNYASSDAYDKALPALQKAAAGTPVAGGQVHVTGASILASGGESGGSSALVETMLAGVGALIVLAIIFGSFLALIPLIIAGVAIPTAFVGVYLLSYATTMSSLVQNIVPLVGLGVAVDYALLIVTRWREERGKGVPNRDAVIKASSTAGKSVLFSGVTVTVSLAALALATVPFLRSIGLAGLLIPLISIAVASTLLPVILDTIGPKLEFPRKKPARTVSPFWTKLSQLVVKHRIIAAAGSLIVLGLLIAPVFGINIGEPQASATAATAPADARAGYQSLVKSGLGAGVLRPTEILSPIGGRKFSPPAGVTAVQPSAWHQDGFTITDAWTKADPSTGQGKSDLAVIAKAAKSVDGARVGGAPAQDHNEISALYGRNLFIIVAAIVILTVVLLARALKSLWLPVKALLLNLISLAASFGILVFVWQNGHGTSTLFNSPATGAITVWVPLSVFALLFGLSMDYEVFILSRINEEREAGHDPDEAVVRAMGHTGRLVFAGGLILGLAFIALGGVPQTDVKILSTGLAAGVLVDITIVRGILAPALVALMGQQNWWLPRAAGKVLRVHPLTPHPLDGLPKADVADATSSA